MVLPTDTVYGVGADAFNPDAVRALLDAKGRGHDMPSPVLVGSWATLEGIAGQVPSAARRLIEAFWPGGLSLVVTHAPTLRWDLGETGGTVMVRMPMHPVAIELLRAVGPMAVSSANITGGAPAITAQAAREQLGESVAVYLDGGTAFTGIASTIVDVTGERPRILRSGAISAEQIGQVCPDVELANQV